jgi:hypothetical protein
MSTVTAVFLRNTLCAILEHVDQTPGLDPDFPGLLEFKETLIQRIQQLRNENLPGRPRLGGPSRMSIQPDRSLVDALHDTLRKAEADPDPETTSLAELKRILRQRIAQLESAEHMLEFK